jgi:uncharacterized protein
MAFEQDIINGYTHKAESFTIGAAMHQGTVYPNAKINIPYKTLNRHGLIAGATGTGKTKSLQAFTEALSNASVSVLLMDIKGDLSGIAASGQLNEKLSKRVEQLGLNYQPSSFPVELLTLSEQAGVRLRATVSEFGPILISRILNLNTTQESVMSMVFKYCDDKQLPLLDLKDLIKVLQYISNEGKDELKQDYGNISSSTVGTIMRQVIGLQQQGADLFFGEKSFEVDDLMRISDDGRGVVNIVRLTDVQDKPQLFSTFMLQLLAELYGSMPEAGDMDKPKLIIFIDEAHLVFNQASEVLLQQLETIIKLIRSKGVGIYFCTQNPTDIPNSILSQLGLKIQHALRAFTAKDRQDIKKVAENYPESNYYAVEDIITQLGIGEAFVTVLNEQGIPTPLVQCMMYPPSSRMDILSPAEIDSLVNDSALAKKYNQVIDSQSAYEILSSKLAEAASGGDTTTTTKSGKPAPAEKSTLETILDNPVAKQVGRTAASVLTRTLLGALGLGGRSKKKGLFGF